MDTSLGGETHPLPSPLDTEEWVKPPKVSQTPTNFAFCRQEAIPCSVDKGALGKSFYPSQPKNDLGSVGLRSPSQPTTEGDRRVGVGIPEGMGNFIPLRLFPAPVFSSFRKMEQVFLTRHVSTFF